jgi:hypothetical protein
MYLFGNNTLPICTPLHLQEYVDEDDDDEDDEKEAKVRFCKLWTYHAISIYGANTAAFTQKIISIFFNRIVTMDSFRNIQIVV